jgi:ABC-2 type transport system ATP-binding protein
MIEVTGLEKHYTVAEKEPGLAGSIRSFFSRKTKTVKAVDGVSFSIAPGEMVGFLGANGAGKTTTLKMLSGLLHPTAGSARVAGFTPFERRASFLKTITLVMGQKQQLLWDLPALDSFQVNRAIYEISDAEYAATMFEFTELLDLEGILKKQVRKLSLGERMKCELAAALLHRPQVLFLDEPTIGLDVNMQVRIREFVAAYNARFDATVIALHGGRDGALQAHHRRRQGSYHLRRRPQRPDRAILARENRQTATRVECDPRAPRDVCARAALGWAVRRVARAS